MGALALRHVTGPAGAAPLVADVTLRVDSGRVAALIGPSGAGKTTVLRLVAGLLPLAAGHVEAGGVRLDRLPTGERDVAYVDQESTLYRHLDVEGNVSFPLRLRHVAEPERRRRVGAESRVHRLTRLLRRRVTTLSAGQRQQVALARGTVRVPSVVLLDEPLAQIDAAERARVRAELATYLRGLDAPTLLATNDQVEAMSLGDHLVVLHEGRVVQQGAPQEVYEAPASAFVATFVGSPGAALVAARVAAGERTVQVRVGDGAWRVEPAVGPVRLLDERPVTVGVRPEHLRLVADADEGVPGRVRHVERLGDHALVHVDVGEPPATVVVRVDVAAPAPGPRVRVGADPAQIRVFDPATGHAVGSDHPTEVG